MKTKIETPRSNAAAEGALKMLTACKSSGDFKTAVKSIVECMLDLCKDLESELAERKTMCDERLAHIATQNDRISLAETHVKALQKDIETMKYLEDESQHGVDELRRKLDMNEAKNPARERELDKTTALYNAATDYAAYVNSEKHDFDEAMKLSDALEAAAVSYAELAGDRQPAMSKTPKPKDFRVPFDTIKTYITEQGPQSHVRIVQCKPVMCEQHCIIGQLTLTQDAVRIENWLRNGGLRDIMECAQKWVLPI